MDNDQFILTADPAPTVRALQGRSQRKQLAYRFRNIAYDAVEVFMKRWIAHRSKLPSKAQAVLGVPTVPAAVRVLRPSLQPMMRVLGLTRPRDFLAAYARTGEHSWNWDHRFPLRCVDGFNTSEIKQGRHIYNLRPRLAARNKARKFEAPATHPELF